ncbi:cyclic nucleotide-binding domain-containing protein [Methylobacterium sp. sgz302541]|uniref:cyclic nucleotide-binding domain-containing protein n=1 Tax=unclassified Methylobacterium TaxID=2615210 RepID=UPI003D34921C
MESRYSSALGQAPPSRRVRRGLDGLPRTAAAALVTSIVLVTDLMAYVQLVFAGPLAGAIADGLSAMLMAYVAGSLLLSAIRRGVPITLSFIGAAAIVQAAIAASVAAHLAATGVTDARAIGHAAILVCGIATGVTGIAFLALGFCRMSLLAQLLPYPVLTGYLGGIGLLFISGGLHVGAGLDGAVRSLGEGVRPASVEQALATVTIGVGAFYLPRRIRHWSVYPALILGSALAVHAARLALGIDIPTAQAEGWLIGPLPHGSLLRMPQILDGTGLDAGSLLPLAPKLATLVLVAVIVQVLYVLSIELDLKRDLHVDRIFVATGAANLLGGLAGGLTLGVGRTSTLTLHSNGGGNRLGYALVVAGQAALLLGGAGLLELMPRPIGGGTLVAIGLGLVGRLVGECRTLPRWEAGTALVVCFGAAILGTVDGFLIGLALAILIFALQYGRIPAVRVVLDGAERPSSVIRSPEAARLLMAAGRRTLVFKLQGYLFFLNAQTVRRRIKAAATAAPDLRTVVLDFEECVALDSSALVAFRAIAQIADEHRFDLLLVHVPASVRGQIAATAPRARAVDTLDHALQRAEAALLAEAGGHAGESEETLARQIGRALGCTIPESELGPYLTPMSLDPGARLIRQGDEAEAMYFVEAGTVSIELERPGRPNLRLRTTTAGTLIGEIALVRGGARTASALAESPCRVVALDRAALARMEHERPDLASRVQRFLILQLAGKLADTNRLLDAVMR